MQKKTNREKRRKERRGQNPSLALEWNGIDRRSKIDRRKKQPVSATETIDFSTIEDPRRRKYLERRFKDKDHTMKRKNERFIKENLYQ